MCVSKAVKRLEISIFVPKMIKNYFGIPVSSLPFATEKVTEYFEFPMKNVWVKFLGFSCLPFGGVPLILYLGLVGKK